MMCKSRSSTITGRGYPITSSSIGRKTKAPSRSLAIAIRPNGTSACDQTPRGACYYHGSAFALEPRGIASFYTTRRQTRRLAITRRSPRKWPDCKRGFANWRNYFVGGTAALRPTIRTASRLGPGRIVYPLLVAGNAQVDGQASIDLIQRFLR